MFRADKYFNLSLFSAVSLEVLIIFPKKEGHVISVFLFSLAILFIDF